jgi:hypothetical protein
LPTEVVRVSVLLRQKWPIFFRKSEKFGRAGDWDRRLFCYSKGLVQSQINGISAILVA